MDRTGDLRAYAVDRELGRTDRAQLNAWLEGSTTGLNAIRAGVPDGWTVGDKTGGGDYGTRNDIAVLHPPAGAPIVLAVMTTHDDPGAARDEPLIAEATVLVVRRIR